MAYTYDNEGNLIDMDMKLPETKRKPVRKPNAVPPKTKTIIKAQSGGPVKPVVRKENLSERIQRMTYQYDGKPNDKPPPHYNNPYIIDEENYGKRPKPFDNNDPSTYPSDRDQRQKLNTWDLILETSKGDKEQMKEIRQTLNEEYKRNGKKFLSDKELKIIGRHPVQQIKLPEVNIPSSITNNTITPPKVQVPEKSLDQIIKEKADARLKREQEAYDKEYGVGGIPKILRPE
jgi:hypothetical protein|tara:strand:+ start:369 stop:1064 length:696 start_codon:yes stop_codon:yes gene_type:complete